VTPLKGVINKYKLRISQSGLTLDYEKTHDRWCGRGNLLHPFLHSLDANRIPPNITDRSNGPFRMYDTLFHVAASVFPRRLVLTTPKFY
jgi:hypothetical protein